MRTELTGPMDEEMVEKMNKAVQLFMGEEVRIIIEKGNGERKRGKQHG